MKIAIFLVNFLRYIISCGQAKRGVCPDPQGEEEGKRGGQDGSRRGCQGSQYTVFLMMTSSVVM
jgi:hypothetical protein